MKYIKFIIATFVAILLNSCAALIDLADALSETSNTTSNTSSASYTNSSSNTDVYTSSYNTNSSSTTKKTRVKVECWACKGTGKSSSKNYPATYGLSANEAKEAYCKYCGKKDKVHTHKTCTACKGLGYTYEYK